MWNPARAKCVLKKTSSAATKTKNKTPPSDGELDQNVSSPLVWEGVPREDLGQPWPEGWMKRTFKRMTGKSAGTVDSYWYTPVLKYKLRSVKEVKRFLRAMEVYQTTDESIGKKHMKDF